MKKPLIGVLLFCLVLYAQNSTATSHGIYESLEETLTESVSNDLGENPWVVDIEEITLKNVLFREAKWTGKYIQMTLMSIPVGGEIGGEAHDNNDQFIRVESGAARVMMGKSADNITFDREISDDWVVFVPAGYWHNLVNIGDEPVKLYSIYGPPEHPKGTTHNTFEESEADHHHH